MACKRRHWSYDEIADAIMQRIPRTQKLTQDKKLQLETEREKRALVLRSLLKNDQLANRDGHVSPESLARATLSSSSSTFKATKQNQALLAKIYELHTLFLVAETDLCEGFDATERAQMFTQWSHCVQSQLPFVFTIDSRHI
jgi:hypothetical protein